MIFVGNGALLKSAITHTLTQGHKIDMIYSPSQELDNFFSKHNLSFRLTADINKEAINFSSVCEDKTVFSINNGQLFNKETLSLPGFRFYNIHNGIVPCYRGLPEICIIFSILNNEKEYGVSLHEIDPGIDTGKCLVIEKFPIGPNDDFESVMTKSIELCKDVFIKNLEKIVKGQFAATINPSGSSRLYSYKDLGSLATHAEHPHFKKAIKLGVYRLWYKKLHTVLETIPAH